MAQLHVSSALDPVPNPFFSLSTTFVINDSECALGTGLNDIRLESESKSKKDGER